MRPRSEIYTMGYQPPVPQSVIGPQLVKEYGDPVANTAARRAIGDPLMTQLIDIEALRTKLEGTPRPRVLAQSRGGRRNARVQGIPSPRVSAERVGVARSRRPPRIPEADGRVAALAGVSCLHAPADRGARALRPSAGRARARQAALLRDGDAVDGAGMGLLVESHEGRPTKIEGNPDHPSSRGATDLFAQAAILDLYDPDRSQTITHLGEIRTFEAFVAALPGSRAPHSRDRRVPGLRILSETVASPTLDAQIDELLGRLPQAKWMQWEPFGRHNAREGSRLAFGEYVDAQYAIEKADVVLSLDADFLCTGGGALRHARAFASRRRIEGNKAEFQPPLRRRIVAVQHRLEGGPPAAASRLGDRRLRPRGCGGGSASVRQATAAAARASPKLVRGAREGPAGRARAQPRHRRRHAAAGGPRARPCDERGARQRRRHRHLHADRGSSSLESARRVEGAGRGDERRHGRASCFFSAATRFTRRRPT